MIIDGKAIAARVRAEVAAQVKEIEARAGVKPGLALIRVGNDAASEIYVRGKAKACQETGMAGFEHILPEATTQVDLLALVATLNADAAVHGVLVQLPLPKQIDADAVLETLSPHKDVDGFGPLNAGALFTGRKGLRPCTPLGILRLLDEAQTPLHGARALVVGRSNIVGKPVAMLLLERHATVTLAHSRTQHLDEEVARADVLVAAVGKTE
ncbi:MAG TPA: bifunctional 5,10-methylenetetrahydrofolate dehydrogenase/5,10-methenyltetrahydrofolate cyclohydrolase, partial [Dongiaceae bacterium]